MKISRVRVSKGSISKGSISKVSVSNHSVYVENNTGFRIAYTSITLAGALAGSLISRLLEGLMSSELRNHSRP
jgi:hypothetical protein